MSLGLAACSDAPAPDALELAIREERAEADRTLVREPYHAARAQRWGTIRGSITVRGEARRDTVVAVHDVAHICGERMTLPLVRGDRGVVADAIVWIDGIRAGKALPLSRRFEVLYARCRLEPSVQTAIAGGMLMVRSSDPIEHRTRMIRAATGDVLGTVRQGDAGSLVPVPDVLESPGLVELRSEPRPWARAWVRVFDHPYHQVTPRTGRFALDSVPPGRHRVTAWHPALGRIATDVVLAAGDTVEVNLAFEVPASIEPPNRVRPPQ